MGYYSELYGQFYVTTVKERDGSGVVNFIQQESVFVLLGRHGTLKVLIYTCIYCVNPQPLVSIKLPCIL